MSDLIAQQIEHNFIYHPPKGDQSRQYEALRAKGKELAILINETCPDGREKAVALTNLEQTIMWANAAIAREK